MPKKKVFITGEGGNIGTALIELYRSDPAYLIINDLKECDELARFNKSTMPLVFNHRYKDEIHMLGDYGKTKLAEIFEKYPPTIIMHTAAAVGTDKCEREHDGAYYANVEIIRDLADVLRVSNCHNTTFVNFSTTATMDPAAYGMSNGINELTPRSPKTWYGATKYMGEMVTKFSFKNWINLLPVFLFSTFPSDTSSIWAKVFVSSNNGIKYDIKLNPEIYKQYEYVTNMTNVLKRIAENKENNGKDIVICGQDQQPFGYFLEEAQKAYLAKFKTELLFKLNPKEDYLKNHITSKIAFNNMLQCAGMTEEEFNAGRKTFTQAIKEVAESIPSDAKLRL
jgi:nucleoside-diphosphate-sugar epimerase